MLKAWKMKTTFFLLFKKDTLNCPVFFNRKNYKELNQNTKGIGMLDLFTNSRKRNNEINLNFLTLHAILAFMPIILKTYEPWISKN